MNNISEKTITIAAEHGDQQIYALVQGQLAVHPSWWVEGWREYAYTPSPTSPADERCTTTASRAGK